MSGPRKQCRTCPWKMGADPHAIPNGYSVEKHRALAGTIAEPGSTSGIGRALRVMACHYSNAGTEIPCVGWLAHQLGPGNNIALRLRAMTDRSFGDIEIDGPQHARFKDTLPR